MFIHANISGGVIMKKNYAFDFNAYQTKNELLVVKSTIEKIVKDWLTENESSGDTISLLRELLNADPEFPTISPNELLPDFIQRLWSQPHQCIPSLSKSTTNKDIKELIQDIIRQELMQYPAHDVKAASKNNSFF